MNPPHVGPYGVAAEVATPDVPESAQSVCRWLITAPSYHPFWSQYVLAVVRLDDVEGFPPPIRKFEGATHELLVVVLNPEHGPVTVEDMERPDHQMRYLTPINIAEQFTASDDEMRRLAADAADAVVFGVLPPETGDAPERIWEEWLTSLVRTLAHYRGEEHAP